MSQPVGFINLKRLTPVSSATSETPQAVPTREIPTTSPSVSSSADQQKSLRKFRRRAEAEAAIDPEKLKTKNPIIVIHEAAQEVSEFGKVNLKGTKEFIKECEKITKAVSAEKTLKHEEGMQQFSKMKHYSVGLGVTSLFLSFCQDGLAKSLSDLHIPLISHVPGHEWSGMLTRTGDTYLQSMQQQAQQEIQSKTQFFDYRYQLDQTLERQAREQQSTEERTDQEHTQTLAREGLRAATQILTGGRA